MKRLYHTAWIRGIVAGWSVFLYYGSVSASVAQLVEQASYTRPVHGSNPCTRTTMIKFNEVTWYSKLAAIIFFMGALPALSFYIGTQYQLANESGQAAAINEAHQSTKLQNLNAANSLAYMQKMTCNNYPNYFVITHSLEDVGEAVLIKKKVSVDQKFDCSYNLEEDDFEIKRSPEFFKAIEGDFLITDIGTGPYPRSLAVYDLRSQKAVFDSGYSVPIDIRDGTITYWKTISEKPNEANCPELEQYAKEYLGAGIESHVVLNLNDLTEKGLGEKRCKPRQ